MKIITKLNGTVKRDRREQYLKNKNTVIKVIKKAKRNIKVKNKYGLLNGKARIQTFLLCDGLSFLCVKTKIFVLIM